MENGQNKQPLNWKGDFNWLENNNNNENEY